MNKTRSRLSRNMIKMCLGSRRPSWNAPFLVMTLKRADLPFARSKHSPERCLFNYGTASSYIRQLCIYLPTLLYPRSTIVTYSLRCDRMNLYGIHTYWPELDFFPYRILRRACVCVCQCLRLYLSLSLRPGEGALGGPTIQRTTL